MNKFHRNLNQNTIVSIHENAWESSSAKCRPCSKLIEIGWCTYASVNWAINGSVNCLSPTRCQANIQNKACLLLIEPLGTVGCETLAGIILLWLDCLNILELPQSQWASCQIRKIAVCACAGNAGNVFPRRRLQRKSLVSDPGMHHGTCVTHVPWCMPGSLARGGGENFPGIPGACAPAILRIW